MQIYTFDFGYAKEALRFLGEPFFYCLCFRAQILQFFWQKDCMAKNCVLQ